MWRTKYLTTIIEIRNQGQESRLNTTWSRIVNYRPSYNLPDSAFQLRYLGYLYDSSSFCLVGCGVVWTGVGQGQGGWGKLQVMDSIPVLRLRMGVGSGLGYLSSWSTRGLIEKTLGTVSGIVSNTNCSGREIGLGRKQVEI